MPKSKGKAYGVDGRDYACAISTGGFDDDGNVRLRVTARASYGAQSVCVIRGLLNRSYWRDYPELDLFQEHTIQVTPAAVCKLIRFAHAQGWDPESSKSDVELQITNEDFRALLAEEGSGPGSSGGPARGRGGPSG